MKNSSKLVLLVAALFAMLAPWSSVGAAPRCFGETNQCLDGRIREYWERNGGLPVFGFPVSAQAPEANRDTGQTFQTQWMERNRFEVHPENQAPYDVLLGRLGDDRLRQLGVDWQALPKADPNTPHYFAASGHAIAHGPFWQYWSTHGLELGDRGTSERESLALFGLPITEPKVETNSSGDTVLTQWFERARFEDHGQKGVLLGLLGNEVRTNSGPTPSPQPQPSPSPAPPTARNVVVLTHSTYTSEYSNTRYIVGEVQNNTGGHVRFVKIVASFYNAGNTLVGTESTYTDVDVLRPGQRSPFKAISSSPPADFAYYTLQTEWRASNEQPLDGIVITTHGVRQSQYSDTRYVFGEVRNDSGGAVRFVEIVGTFYNDQGVVIQVENTYTSLEQLAVGQTSPFEMIVPQWNNAVRYELQVQARRP